MGQAQRRPTSEGVWWAGAALVPPYVLKCHPPPPHKPVAADAEYPQRADHPDASQRRQFASTSVAITNQTVREDFFIPLFSPNLPSFPSSQPSPLEGNLAIWWPLGHNGVVATGGRAKCCQKPPACVFSATNGRDFMASDVCPCSNDPRHAVPGLLL